jgi:flavin-binding protein dodecin
VRRHRYRTPALTGPWRESYEDAVRDAVNAKQAQYDDDQPDGIKWTVPGEIEVRNNEEVRATARR